MHFARVNGVLLHYRLAGREGAPVLTFVNSLGTDARIWDGIIAALSDNYRILSYDKRGHGLSDAPPGEYTLGDHLSDLGGLLDHLDIGRTALAGVSIGGLITQGFALRDPARLSAIVLSNTAPRMGDPAMWAARMETARGQGLSGMADAIMERWFSPGFRREQPEQLAGWRNLFLATDPLGYAATCATLRDADLTPFLPRIALPTLVVAGSDDLAAPPDLVRNCNAIPGARFHLFEGVGHIPSIECPNALAALIRTFLEETAHG